jgi:ABC-type transporter MlaC component
MTAARPLSVVRPRALGALAAVVGGLALSLAAPAWAAPTDPVMDLHAGLLKLAQTGWPPAGAAMAPLIDKDFDVAAITRAVLGDQAATATPAQTARLAHALTLKLEQEIARNRAPAPGDGFTVVGTKAAGDGEWTVTTQSNVSKAGGGAAQPSIIAWRVEAGHGEPRIVDTVRSGVSTVQLQHDDFAGALRGRNLDAVIALFEHAAAAKPVKF